MKRSSRIRRLLRTEATILIMLLCIKIALPANVRSTKKPLLLRGRFAARIESPPLTSFGENRETYIFQVAPDPNSQFVILTYTFLIYEPRLPHTVLDYTRLYTLNAVKSEKCDQSPEEISRRYVFSASGRSAITEYGIDYVKSSPSLSWFWTTPLPCYVLLPRSVRPTAVK